MVLHRFADRIREEANIEPTTQQDLFPSGDEQDEASVIVSSNTVQMQDLTTLLGYGQHLLRLGKYASR